MLRINPEKQILKITLFIKRIPRNLRNAWKSISSYAMFLFMFTLYLFNIPTVFLIKSRRTPNFLRFSAMRLNMFISMKVARYDTIHEARMGWFDLFDLAFRNMSFKKTRSFITVGGMALGIGAIVFLVSLGYGIQRLVITRVARLDEMKQIDVSMQPGSKNKLTDRALEDFRSNSNVDGVHPLVGIAAKVKFEGSVTDVAVYGVTTQYLENSAVKPTQGKLFETKDAISFKTYSNDPQGIGGVSNNQDIVSEGEVSGVTVTKIASHIGDKIGDIEYTIFPNTWLRVRKSPVNNSEVIGYTRRVVGVQYGEEFWGKEYPPEEFGRAAQNLEGEWMGKWIKSLVPVWEVKSCSDEDSLCEEGNYYPVYDEFGKQKYVIGYIAEVEIVVQKVVSGDISKQADVMGIEDVRVVLGDSAPGDSNSVGNTALANNTGQSNPTPNEILDQLSDDEYIAKVYESSSSANIKQVTKTPLPDGAQKEAVVNNAFLKVLGFKEEGSVGNSFSASFVVAGTFLDTNEKVESEFTDYKIVGVIPGDDAPFFYVPINDLKYLGITNYSQAKVVASSIEKLAEVRKKVEASGFLTNSVADTVAQINSLFSTVRLILALLGGVALSVASLGMFNTLTVSLLERTREVGLMKAMGMATEEVKRLFLTESMLMGFLGGMVGILIGFTAGKLLSLVLSVFGLMKGVGFIDITYIPPTFFVLIFILSLVVGLVTGVYPSKRATKISALDALRYE